MRHEEIIGLLPRLDWAIDANPGRWMLFLELLFWVTVVLATLALLRYRPRIFEKLEGFVTVISRQRAAWLIAFPVLVLVIRTALLPWMPIPAPLVHDEFSFLLGGDTYAHGRLTNPPHPMWVHFEGFHINMQPTYESMYPPAQGLALAAGEKLTGVPWAGVVLSTALMCSAIYWMLLGWLPAPWAWLGGAFAVVRYGIFSYWINTYFGGSVTAIGGALLLGALPRLRRELRASTAVVFASGLLILANSRPLEGFCFCIPIVVAALFVVFKKRANNFSFAAKKLAPALVLLVAGFGWMLYFNWRGTGNPLLMPYVLNYKTYHISKPFLFQKPNPIPEYHHHVMRVFYVYHELTDVFRVKFEGPLFYIRTKAVTYYSFFVWPLLFLLAPALYTMFRDKEFRVVPTAVLLLGADLFAQLWPGSGHYAAPAAGAVILMVLYSLRHFRYSNAEHGLWGTRALVAIMAVWLVSPIAERIRDPFMIMPITVSKGKVEATVYSRIGLDIQRERIQADLERRGGKHLVIVHHPWHDLAWHDWIYNQADIDHAPVVWARDMGYEANKELLAYYPDRQVWFVDRGEMFTRLVPYSDAMLEWRLALDGPKFGIYPNSPTESAQKAVSAGDAAVGSAARLVTISNTKKGTHR